MKLIIKIIAKPALTIQLNFITKGISHIKNGCAMLGTKSRNSYAMTTNNAITIKIDKI